ncbi:MAG: GAF domain-containing protein [Gammaproteobacteria bacterium]|nr:GAF domain-containing protein [Gammaproteobacteria bacterium]
MERPMIPAMRLADLISAAAAVTGQTELTAVLETVVTTAKELTGAPFGALGVVSEDGQLIQFVYKGVPEEVAEMIGGPPEGKGLLGAVTWQPDPIRLDNTQSHPRASGFPDHHPHFEGFLGTSIRIGDDVFGNLYLGASDGGFTEQDETLIRALALIAGSAISTIRLQARLRRAAVLEDRQRIARDLHDSIIQDLFAVGLSLQALTAKLPDEEMRTSLEEAASHLDASITSLRRLIFDLRPPTLGARNLKDELSELLGRLAVPYEASIGIGVTGPVDDLPAEIVEDTLQIIREAVSNALRHSGADVVSVSVSRGIDRLVLAVFDRGKGFDLDTVTRGMGLDNIQSRAEAAGGEAEISSRPGGGTTIRVVLPL